jgi:hypothetical protein
MRWVSISAEFDRGVVEKNNVTFWPLAVFMEYCTYKYFIKEEEMKATKLLITLCVPGKQAGC